MVQVDDVVNYYVEQDVEGLPPFQILDGKVLLVNEDSTVNLLVTLDESGNKREIDNVAECTEPTDACFAPRT